MKRNCTIITITRRMLITLALGILWGLPRVIAQEPEIKWQNCYNPIHQFRIAVCPYPEGIFTLRSGEQKSTIQLNGFLGYPDIEIMRFDSIGNRIWKKSYGGSHYEYVVQMLEYSKDRYYVLGAARSNDGHVQSGNKGNFDIWVFVIDTSGNILWEKTYGTPGIDVPVRMEKLSDGSLLVCGNIHQQGGDVDTAYGGRDIWFYRIDTLGNILWQKTLGAEGNNECTDFIINDKGNIVLTGTNAGDYFSACYAPENQNILLMEIDLEGKILWNRCYGSWSPDYGGCVAQCKDGYVFAGSVFGTGEYVEGYHKYEGSLLLTTSDVWLVRTDRLGFIKWKKCLGGSENEEPKSLIADEAGDIYLFANTNSNNYDVKRLLGSGGPNMDIWMMKYFADGGLIYKRCIGGRGDDELSMKSSVVMKDGKSFILSAGTLSSQTGDVACENPHLLHSMWLFEMERCDNYEAGVPGQPAGHNEVYSLSEPESEYTITPSDNNWRFEWRLEPPEAGRVISQGLTVKVQWTNGYSGEAWLSVRAYSACGFSDWSSPLMINVQNTYGTGLQLTTGLRLWPNPADDMLYIAFPAATHLPVLLTLSDLTGRVLLSQEISQPHSVISLSGLPRGAYFCRLASKEINVTAKIIKGL